MAGAVATALMLTVTAVLLGILGYGRQAHARSLVVIGVAFIPLSGLMALVGFWLRSAGMPVEGAGWMGVLMAAACIVGLIYYFIGVYKRLNP